MGPDGPKLTAALPDGRVAVVTRHGEFFVHDPATGESSWDVPKDPVFIVLLARARGLPGGVEAVEADPVEPVELVKADPVEPVEAQPVEPVELVEAEPVELEAQPVELEAQPVELEAELGTDSDLDLEDTDLEDTDAFLAMLANAKPNPFKAWESHRDSLAELPGYDAIDTNARRQQLYSEWAAGARGQAASPADTFLALVHREYDPARFYMQFKRQFRGAPEFDVAMPDKVKEQLFREYGRALRKTPAERDAVVQSSPPTDPRHIANAFVNSAS